MYAKCVSCRGFSTEFIRGLRDNFIREQLLQTDATKFHDIVDRAVVLEGSRIQSKELMKQTFWSDQKAIGDNQSLLQSVKNAADYGSFSERAEMWATRLADLEGHLTSLAQIRRKWIYLESIFGEGALVQERGRFERLDKDLSTLINLQGQLSRCQSSLENFLQDKRNKFSRFLFLGDDDLREIVGHCSKEQVIQRHLKKLFSGIHSINLDSEGKKIVAMCSLQGETVLLNNLVNIEQPVEVIMAANVNEQQIQKWLMEENEDSDLPSDTEEGKDHFVDQEEDDQDEVFSKDDMSLSILLTSLEMAQDGFHNIVSRAPGPLDIAKGDFIFTLIA
ncbi:hypothetical protein RN001_004112 [Aquatica leii]|uniref:Dynein heavy chain linker domain-containing protein n=1 Tax=Aquatica leii TaxID=1421715 RepID=A0AAN7PRV3_9COLE|nr:hypothetical protein RN001_004112 [Aquatica leii]